MLITNTCPRCSASLEYDDTKKIVYCEYCGYKLITIEDKAAPGTAAPDAVPAKRGWLYEPNLHISFHTAVQGVIMVVRIVASGQKESAFSGQTLSFRLPAGSQQIVIKIGAKNYNRVVNIPEDGSPVRIDACCNGAVNKIYIHEPECENPAAKPITYANVNKTAPARTIPDQTAYDEQPAYESSSNTAAPVKKSPIAIAAFVLSFTGFLSIVGILLGLYQLKNRPDEGGKGFCIAAILIGGLMLLSTVFSIFSCAPAQAATAAITSDFVCLP